MTSRRAWFVRPAALRVCRWPLLAVLAAEQGCAKSSPANDESVSFADETAPPLVRVDGLPPASARSQLTVWVTPREVRVVRSVERTVPRDEVEARAHPEDAREHMIAPVHDAIARILAQSAATERHVAYMVVGHDVPFSTLVDVIYSAGRAGINEYAFALEGPDGASAIEIVPPALIDPAAEADGPTCVLPRFVFATDGTYVNARLVDLAGLEASNDAAWADKPLVDASGACPPLPADASAKIATFSKQLAALGPECGYAVVTAENTVTWGSIAPSLAALAKDAGLVPLILEAGANIRGSCDTPYTL